MNTRLRIAESAAILTLLLVMLSPVRAMAHCDGLDGPVVKAAQQALEKGDVNLVLVWVQREDDEEIRQAFKRTLMVRKLGRDAQELADLFFFETLVRIHRAREGAPYTGLKPAGRDLGPAIPLADRVLTTGEIDPLVRRVTDETTRGLVERFDHVRAARNYATTEIEAGRQYVRAYVTFIHYVDRAYEAAIQSSGGHFTDSLDAGNRRED